MHPNALVHLPPERVLDHLADWALETWNRWFPFGGGVDLCDYVPCAWVNEDGEFVADLDDRDRDEADEAGLTIDHDPRWEGETLAIDEIRGKDVYGRWKNVDVQVRAEYDPMGLWISGYYDAKQGPGGTIAVNLNFARFDDCHGALRPGHWEDQTRTKRQLRAVLVHEMTHAFGPRKVRLEPLDDPHAPMLPWDREAWAREYMTGPDEYDSFAREMYQRMRDIWLHLDDSWKGEKNSYPFALQRALFDSEDGEHLQVFFNALDDKRRRILVGDVGRAMRLFVRRQLRRRSGR